jgi:hypothetical protein
VDVKRAADLYAQGRTLRQIGAELGIHWSTVGQQLLSAGVSIRSVGIPSDPVSTQQIVELRDQGLTLERDSRTGRYDGFWRLKPLPEGPDTTIPPLGPLAACSRRWTTQESCYWRTRSRR